MADTPMRSVRRALLDGRRGVWAEPPIAVDRPHQHMGVQQNQRSAAQSEGDAAGASGASYASTVPRISAEKGRRFALHRRRRQDRHRDARAW